MHVNALGFQKCSPACSNAFLACFFETSFLRSHCRQLRRFNIGRCLANVVFASAIGNQTNEVVPFYVHQERLGRVEDCGQDLVWIERQMCRVDEAAETTNQFLFQR